MAWTSPRTWVAGEIVTAAIGNTHWRDNLKAIGDAWTSGTATFSATGGGFSLGNGTSAAAFASAGKFARTRILLTLGSSTSMGSGRIQVTLGGGIPAAPTGGQAGGAFLYDSSAAAGWSGAVRFATTTVLDVGGPTGNVTATAPFTWATSDTLAIKLDYESA